MTPLEQNLRGHAEQIGEAIRSGTIDHASRATLLKYSAWLCERESTGPFATATEHAQASELVRLHLLRSMIDAFEKRSKVMQNWMLFFAVLAVFAPFVQPFIMAQSTASPTSSAAQAANASALPAQPLSASTPTPVLPPPSSPTTATGGSAATKAASAPAVN